MSVAAPVLEQDKDLDSEWRKAVAPYQHPVAWRSWMQVANSILPFLALWAAAYWALEVSYAATVGLGVLAAGFLVRIFIIFHDCGHGSFFRSQRMNDLMGYITGVLTFTPYHQWRHEHAVHHATSGDLDRRGTGDITTWTIREYLRATPWARLRYRLYRNPLVLFLIGPIFHFLITQRFPFRGESARERMSVHITNLALLVIVGGLVWSIGWKAFLLVQTPIVVVAFATGVWLFYVQHQFEDTYWEYHPEWDFTTAALRGSTFYDLPPVLRFFSGNIGYHHIHHLASRIPNYFLEPCFRNNPLFHEVSRLTLLQSLKTMRYRLWDEDGKRMVGFRDVRHLIGATPAQGGGNP